MKLVMAPPLPYKAHIAFSEITCMIILLYASETKAQKMNIGVPATS